MNYRQASLCCIIAVIAVLMMISVASASSSSTRTITDMADRTVTIPTNITHVLGTAPPVTVMTYIIAPDLLQGFNSDYNSSPYLPDKYRYLPNAGGTQGNSKLNAESFFSMNPDIILVGYMPDWNVKSDIDDIQQQLNPIPVIAVKDITDINNFAPGMEFLGDILNNPKQAEEFNTFYRDIYDRVNKTTASITESERKRVYYAEGPEGLKTDPAETMHAQPINVCNGINVADFPMTSMVGNTPVSLEQVMNWDPDVIIASDNKFYGKVYTDPNWQNFRAVKEKQVYLIPNQPFSWYDRSPGVNIVMGIPWTAKVLYPDLFKDIDLKSLTREFYSKFYHYDLTDDEVAKLISGSGLSV